MKDAVSTLVLDSAGLSGWIAQDRKIAGLLQAFYEQVPIRWSARTRSSR